MPNDFLTRLESLMERATKGPWRVAPAHEYKDSEINIDAGTRAYVAQCGHRGDDEAEHNAAIIAFLANHAPAIAEVVRGMQKIAEWGCDEAEQYDGECASDIVRLAQKSLTALNAGQEIGG